MLSIEAITKRFGNRVALDNVSLSIADGECFGLLGPNGAGKSTLMSLVAGLRTPDHGSIALDGVPLSIGNSKARLSIGFVPQSIALYRELTPEQNLRFFGELYGLRGAVLRERIEEALEAVQLADRRHDRVGTFSGGMQRRLNLVASLLHRPKLLLCDEPTVGVDPQSRNAIFEFLDKLKKAGLTIIYSTHYMEEAERMCSRIGIIDHGRILALGTQEELLHHLPFVEEIIFPDNAIGSAFAALLKGRGTLFAKDGSFHFRPGNDFPRSAFYACAEGGGYDSRLFVHERPSLESVFLHLTGRTLRD